MHKKYEWPGFGAACEEMTLMATQLQGMTFDGRKMRCRLLGLVNLHSFYLIYSSYAKDYTVVPLNRYRRIEWTNSMVYRTVSFAITDVHSNLRLSESVLFRIDSDVHATDLRD
jgi:hypothetical protein